MTSLLHLIGLQFKWGKCKFKILAILFEWDCKLIISEDQSNIRLSRTENLRQSQSFLGLTDYFIKCISAYSVTNQPLTNVFHYRVSFTFVSNKRLVSLKLKSLLIVESVLQLCHVRVEKEVHTVASKLEIILMQKSVKDKKNCNARRWEL